MRATKEMTGLPKANADERDAGVRLTAAGYPEGYQWRMTPVHLLPPDERLVSHAEVAQGYLTDAEAREEAARCLLCKNPTCISGCPNNNPIPTFLGFVQEGNILDAAVADYEKNALAGCTGRVCNWEAQCEGWCVLNANGEGVRIGAIERYIADYAARHGEAYRALRDRRAAEEATSGISPYVRADVSTYAAAIGAYGADLVPGYSTPPRARHNDAGFVPGYGPMEAPPADVPLDGFRVAVVGSGPAGLACASMLARDRARVVMFEAEDYPGGILSDGIPEFVLPQTVVAREIADILDRGVELRCGQALGRDIHLPDLLRTFNAVFLAIGAEAAHRLDIPGHDAAGVWVAQEFLRRAKRALAAPSAEPAPAVGRRVLVIGAGDTSIDAARTARRLGAADVRIVYRRTSSESPSRPVETALAIAEGVQYAYLVDPLELLRDGAGHVRAARLQRMRLGAIDRSRRARPEPVPGSMYELACDTVIFAIGYGVATLGAIERPDVLNPNGTIRVHGEGGATEVPGLFAGGDVVRGAYTVVHAVRDGRLAADAIGAYLRRNTPR